jgi:hypothetical protein
VRKKKTGRAFSKQLERFQCGRTKQEEQFQNSWKDFSEEEQNSIVLF